MSFIQIPGDAIRDTAAAVFRASAYNRRSLLQVASTWLGEHIRALLLRLRPGSTPRSLVVFAIIVLLLVAVGLLARTAVVLVRDRARRPGHAIDGGDGDTGDARAAAGRLAAHGDYTAAAHALYAAILASIAQRCGVDLHESKTIGDYARDLARRSSALLDRFVEFAGTYEVVIYGLGGCDRARWERLDDLAMGILGSDG